MKKYFLLFWLFLSILISSCGKYGYEQPELTVDLKPGSLVDYQGKPLSKSKFLQLAKSADYILIGETHNIPCDHEVQASLLDSFKSSKMKIALGLEMVTENKQDILDSFNQGELSLENLHQALDWEKIWGHSFSLYQEIFKTANQANYPIYGLNIDPEIISDIRKKGLKNLSCSERHKLPEQIIRPPKEQKKALNQAYKKHKKFLGQMEDIKPEKKRFFLVQSIWDSQMAFRAWKIRQETGLTMVVLSGNGHIEHGWGIPHRLRILDPEANIVTIVGWRGLKEPETSRANFFYFCPLQ